MNGRTVQLFPGLYFNIPKCILFTCIKSDFSNGNMQRSFDDGNVKLLHLDHYCAGALATPGDINHPVTIKFRKVSMFKLTKEKSVTLPCLNGDDVKLIENSSYFGVAATKDAFALLENGKHIGLNQRELYDFDDNYVFSIGLTGEIGSSSDVRLAGVVSVNNYDDFDDFLRAFIRNLHRDSPYMPDKKDDEFDLQDEPDLNWFNRCVTNFAKVVISSLNPLFILTRKLKGPLAKAHFGQHEVSYAVGLIAPHYNGSDDICLGGAEWINRPEGMSDCCFGHIEGFLAPMFYLTDSPRQNALIVEKNALEHGYTTMYAQTTQKDDPDFVEAAVLSGASFFGITGSSSGKTASSESTGNQVIGNHATLVEISEGEIAF